MKTLNFRLNLLTSILFCLFPADYQAANGCNLEYVAYEFFTQVFVLYEEEIAVISQSSANVSIKEP